LSSSGGGLFDGRPKDSNLGLGRFRLSARFRNRHRSHQAMYVQMCKSQSLYKFDCNLKFTSIESRLDNKYRQLRGLQRSRHLVQIRPIVNNMVGKRDRPSLPQGFHRMWQRSC